MIEQVRSDIIVLKAELNNIYKDLDEIKDNQKELIKFMHEIKGGQAWFVGLLTISASAGALISTLIGLISGSLIHGK